jgi:hypothetical protein
MLLLCVAFAACAEVRWSRPDADAAQVSRDLDACRGTALQRPAPPGAAIRDSQSGIERLSGLQPAGTSDNRFIAEHEEVRVCMLKRGYQLRPAS